VAAGFITVVVFGMLVEISVEDLVNFRIETCSLLRHMSGGGSGGVDCSIKIERV
jgi:hypothetical protein